MTTIPIYRALPRMEWSPSSPQYYFRPEVEDHDPYAMIHVPEGWMLVGEGQPLLVRRLNEMDFRTMTATDALYYALARAHGFSIDTPPAEGHPAVLNAQAVQAGLTLPDPPPRRALGGGRRERGLPSPTRNGKAD